jgi:mannosyltransferase OCH1-like enzyme
MIPKKIHFCWFGRKPYPKLIKKCIATWKEQLPDYEFCLWNEENSPMDIPFVQEAYKVKKHAFVADYVRFWALYHHGGIYLDTDMFVLRSFNPFLDKECFFAWETANKNAIGCCVVGCCRSNLFIKQILDRYNTSLFCLEQLNDLIVPRFITPLYETYVQKENITIVEYDYFYPFPYTEKENIKNFMKYKTQNTYAIHLWNISWGNRYKKLSDRILYYMRKLKLK